MRTARQVLWGLFLALVSSGIILGGLSLSLAEGNMNAPLSTTQAILSPTRMPFTPFAHPSQTPVPSVEISQTPIPSTWTSTLSPTTVNTLATSTTTSSSLPYFSPIPTSTPIPCSPLTDWIIYIVQSGDNLYQLSDSYGVTVQDFQQANCMGVATLILVGQTLRVPPWAPHTPSLIQTETLTPTETPTPTETLTPTETPTPTETSVPPTDTP